MRKFLFLFVLGTSSVTAQSVNEVYANSIKAYKHQQYELFLQWAQKLDSMRPAHPVYTRNLASAYALNDKPQQAFAILRKSVLMNSATDFESEADFTSLRGLPEYEQLLALKAAMERPVATSEKVTTLDEKDLHPEGLLYLAKKKKWLVGSIRKGKISEFDIKTGKCTDWLDTDYPVFAMKADAKEEYLWIATSAIDEMEGYKHERDGKGEILQIKLKTKEIVARFAVGGKHLYGDLALAKDGTVYISDSANPVIYKISDGSMVPWLRIDDRLCNFQGITLSGDETKVYLGDYFSGILEVAVSDTAKRRWLVFPDGTTTKGIDGLVWHDNSLIAIHNGVKPIRIMRYFLDASGNIGSFKVIDNNRPEFNEPTVGIGMKNKFYFFGNCPWPAYNAKHQLQPEKLEFPVLYSFGL